MATNEPGAARGKVSKREASQGEAVADLAGGAAMTREHVASRCEKLAMCDGCDQNYYNGKGAKECWHLKTAKPARRWSIGWWTQMDRAENFVPVTTLNCHTRRGKVAYMDRLPEHLGGAAPPKEAADAS